MGCGASTSTAPFNHNGTQPNGNLKNSKVPVTVTKTSLKGDYSQFQLAKYQREKQQKERQQRLYIAADELSGKVLEERERLSLGTRSRATSRNTSRTASPTTNKRNAQNREEHTVPMTPVIEDRNRSESYRSEDSLNRHPVGATTTSEYQVNKKKTKHKTKKKSHKSDKSKSKSKKKSNKKSKSKRMISVESDQHDSGLDDSSDGVQSADVVNREEMVGELEETGVDINANTNDYKRKASDASEDKGESKKLIVQETDEIYETSKVTNEETTGDADYNQPEHTKAIDDNEIESENDTNKHSVTRNEITGDNLGFSEETETGENENTFKKVRFEERNAGETENVSVS